MTDSQYMQPVSERNRRKISNVPLPLPGIVHKNEYTYVLVYQTESWAIYAEHWLAHNGIVYIHVYEVFKKKIKKARVTKINGKFFTFPAKYRFPSNEDFGKWALVFTSIEDALSIINKWENGKLSENVRNRIRNLLNIL